MSDYNLFVQPMSEFCLSSTRFTVFILGPVTTGFFAVPVRGSLSLGHSNGDVEEVWFTVILFSTILHRSH
jgi:hypothetical protein